MLHGLWFHPLTLLCLWLPIGIVLCVFVLLCLYWSRQVRGAAEQTLTLNVSTFSEPINGALTVSGILLPLLLAGTAYLSLQGVATIQLIPWIASGALFILSLLVGLWNLFSLTAARGDRLEITPTHLTGFVAQFVSQLTLMMAAIAVIGVHALAFFAPEQLRPPPAPTPPATITLQRPSLSLGDTAQAVRTRWGEPDRREPSAETEHWIYRTREGSVQVTLRDERVVAILQQLEP